MIVDSITPVQQALATAREALELANLLSRWHYAAARDALTSRATALMHRAMDLAEEALEQARKEGA